MSIRPAWWMTLQALTIPLLRRLLRENQKSVVGRLSGKLINPVMRGRNFNITYLPVNRNIAGIGEMLVPQAVLREAVKQSAHRAIIKRCTCRDGGKCENHPVELGCLLMGEGAAEIDTGVSRHVSVEEALEHVDRCVENGLTPFVGRFKADDYIWGVRDRGRLLTVCFCCRCCCVIKNHVRDLPPATWNSVFKLKGLRIETDRDACTGCGKCVEACFMGARKLENQKIVHDPSLCKGCGQCLTVCPEGAVHAEVSNLEAAVAEVWGRIDNLIDYRSIGR